MAQLYGTFDNVAEHTARILGLLVFVVLLACAGVLYFSIFQSHGSGADIYRSHPVGDAYSKAEVIGAPVSTSAKEHDPFVAPDGSYLIFTYGGFRCHRVTVSGSTVVSIWAQSAQVLDSRTLKESVAPFRMRTFDRTMEVSDPLPQCEILEGQLSVGSQGGNPSSEQR